MRHPRRLLRHLSIFGLGIIALLGCSGDGGGVAPTVTLMVSPEVISVGESAELRWQVRGSEPLTLALTPELVDLELTSPLTVSPRETTTYTLTATNTQGNSSSSVTVRVVDTPTIASFQASATTGTVPLDITFSWSVAASGAPSCSLDTGDGSAVLELTDCSGSQTANHTYTEVGTYTARLELTNGDARELTITVSEDTSANNDVSVGGFVDEQSRNVIVILTGDTTTKTSVDGLARLNSAIAKVEASRGVQPSAPAVRGLNAAVLGLLAGQQSQPPQTANSQPTLVDLASEFVVAVTAQGEVVATSPLERPEDSSQLRFDLDIPVEKTVALLVAEPDMAGGWICKGALEYQTLAGQQTTNSQQAIYRFPASLLNNSNALSAGRFQFNELTAELASRLTSTDASTMQDDLPSNAVQEAVLTLGDAPEFANGIYQLCNNPRARRTNVRAQFDFGSAAQDDASLYDFAMALLLETTTSISDEGEEISTNQLVGTAPTAADGGITMDVVRNGTQNREAGLFITDVAFFDARKQIFPLTPTYQFDATASFGVVSTQSQQQDSVDEIDLGIVRAGLASIRGQILDTNGDPVPNANVIIVLDGQRLSFNVAIADDNGFYELLVPVDANTPYIFYAESPDGRFAGLASNDATGVRFEVTEAGSFTQNIILDVPLPTEPTPPSARPSVNAGEDTSATVGTPVTLRGQASDPDGDSLVLTWQLLGQPTDSTATLVNPTGETATLIPDTAGTYRVRFSAFDGQNFASDIVVVEATTLPVVNVLPLPTLTELVEGEAGTTLELSRSGNLEDTLTVQLAFSDPTTASPDDLVVTGAAPTANGYSVTFTAGNVRTALTLRALEDNLPEAPELLSLNLQADANIRLGSTAEASFIIVDAGSDDVNVTCEGDIEVLTRTALEDLTTCRTITGSLTIRATDLTTLSELASLNSIGGALRVLGSNLGTLEGLDNLLTIGGNLEVTGNASLTSFAGLDALSSIGGDIYIGVNAEGNPSENSILADIRVLADIGLDGDTRVISNNPALDCPAQELGFAVTASDNNLVNCTNNEPGLPSIDSFTATPQVLEEDGQSVLEWTVSGTPPITLTLTAENEFGDTAVTDVSGQTDFTVAPETTTTYSLQAENEVGNDITQLMVTVISDPICNDDYTVTSNADLAALQSCETIVGRLRIIGIEGTDLSPLAGLTTLGGDLIIDANANLTSLAGLEDVVSISGNLAITGNEALTSLAALTSLESLGGSLIITDNPSLVNLAAFPQLQTVGSGVVISDNSGLASLQGLNEITLIQGDLELAGNDVLTDLNGLNNLASLGGSLYIGYDDSTDTINGNPLLTDLGALAALTDSLIGGNERIITGNTTLSCPAQDLQFGVSLSTGNFEDCVPTICIGNATVNSQVELTALSVCVELAGSLQIGADDITTLDDLTGLERIGGDLRIGYLEGADAVGNPQLNSLAGLSSLENVAGDVVVRDNPVLESLAGLEGIENVLGSLELTNNASLEGLTGLEASSITGDLSILENAELSSLAELATLTDADVLGATTISSNPVLDCLAQNLQFTVDSSTDNLTNCNDLVLQVCDSSYTITTQAQLNNLEVCLEITGDLTIGPSANIINLAPLSNLQTLGGTLLIEDNSVLDRLSGLGNVRNVGGDIIISNNPVLTDIGSLQRINTVGTLTINANNSLSSLDGLQGLTNLNNLTITNNLLLTSLDWLENLVTVNGDITINANAVLSSLTAITGITDSNVTGLVTISDNPNLNCPAQGLQFFVDVSVGNALDCGICVLPAGFTISDAVELAALALCRIIIGDLSITGSSDITDLTSLQNLERIEGSLTLESTLTLTGLNGLDKLTTLTGDLTLIGNADLNDVSALGSTPMTMAATSLLTVADNPALSNLDGLQGVTELNSVQLTNTGLTDLTGLNNLVAIGSDLTLLNNANLSNIDALSGLMTVGSSLTVTGNPLLPNLSGLGMLSSIGADLTLDNNGLSELTGLGNLASIGGNLIVTGHAGLEDLTALTNLTTVAGDITISNNDNILFTTLDGLENISAYDDAANTVTVSDNDNLDCLLTAVLPFVVDVSTGNAGNCTRICVGTRTVSSQADLTNLGAELCREITGDLNIVGSTDITMLTPLIELLTIGGNLVISNNTNLQEDNGLNNLASVSGDLVITNNAVLNHISSLNDNPPTEALMTLAPSSQLIVTGNPLLTSLNGLQGLTSLSRVAITDTSLIDLDGLNNLATISGSLELTNNSALTDVSGLDELDSVGGNAIFVNNTSLPNFAGMTDLATVSGDLTLTSNAVTTLTGLTGLNTVGGNLEIDNNVNLVSLAALSNLTTIGGNISVDNNDATGFTSLNGLQNVSGYNDANTVTVQDNDNLNCASSPSLPFMVDVSSGNSVDCTMVCVGNRTVTNQAQLDGITLCREITGSLTITGSSDITTLASLSNLEDLGASLVITGNTALQNVSGLNSLTFIGGNFNVAGNNILTSLNGLSSLASFGGDLRIENNVNLTSLVGLSGIGNVSDLRIADNLSLTSLAALSGISSVTSGHVRIENNDSLANLTGLNNITTVPNDLSIVNNDLLTDLTGLNGFASVGDDLEIRDNVLLANLTGLNSLNSIGSELEIANNPALNSLAAFSSLNTVGTNIIVRNTALVSLNGLQGITSYDNANTVTISDNPNLDCSLVTLPFNVDNSSGNSVDCVPIICVGSPTVTNQAQLNALSSCVEITGSLTVINSADIVNLTALSSLTSLGGNLVIDNNTMLTSIAGLSNLTNLSGNLGIYNNPALINTNGLSNLTSFNGNLNVSNNASLTSLAGLVGINTVDEFVIINNASLLNLTGLNNLTTVGGSFNINDNLNLSSIAQLGNLTGLIPGNIRLANNDSLTTLIGLNGITGVSGELKVEDNLNITSLAGLSGITTVDGNIVIRLNTSTSFTDLNGLQFISGYDDASNTVEIAGNSSLDCSAVPLPFMVDNGAGNAVACP